MNRLVPGAAAAWVAALTTLWCCGRWSVASALFLAALAMLVVVGAVGWIVRRRTKALIVAVAIACGCAGVASAAAFAATLIDSPLAAAAQHGSTVSALVVIEGDIRTRTGGVYGQDLMGDTREARVRVSQVTFTGRTWSVDVPATLRVSSDTALVIGSTVAVRGRASPADPMRGVAAIISVSGLEQVEAPGFVQATANLVRDGLREAASGLDPRAASLIEGLAVGDESSQPAELARQMRTSGLSHLTAVSGGNTSLVIAGVLLIAALLRAPPVVRAGACLVALLGYVVIVGPQPSVLRAAAMGAIVAVALASGNQRRGLASLAASVLVLVIVSPALAAAWGFALSVGATLGLLVISPGLIARLRGSSEGLTGRLRTWLGESLALTLSAQIATVALIASFGNGISLVALPANLVVAPVVAPITILGLLAALISPIAPTPAAWLAHLAEPFAAWISTVADVSSHLPGATLPWPGGFAGAALALLVLAVGFLWLRRRRGRHARVHPAAVLIGASLIAVVAILALRIPERAGWPPEGWVMVACDVGQGDGLVLNAGDASAIVIDAGPDPDAIDHCLTDLGISHVSLLVLTHDHADHVEGVPGVLRGRGIDAALVSPLHEPPEEYSRVMSWLSGAQVTEPPPGQVMDVGSAHLQVLWPQRIIREGSAPNNASVVLLAQVDGVSLLLLGDVETAAQVALRSSIAALGVDVVKVAHHGSRSQDPVLPAWTGAKLAIVSVGVGNPYGHPAPETLAAWQSLGAWVARTDQAGDLAVVRTPDAGVGLVERRGGSG